MDQTTPLPIVMVKWKSRIAGFRRDSVLTIKRNACAHFRLGRMEEGLALVGMIGGVECEITDDILEYIPPGTIISLDRVRSPLDKIYVKMLTGETYIISDIYAHNMVSELMGTIHDITGVPACEQRLTCRRKQLESGHWLSEYNILPESVLDLVTELRGGKPVIYLFPPRLVANATVSVQLIPQWTFSHVYPQTERKVLAHNQEQVSWTVSTSPDGSLVQQGTGLELSYLFWEAITNPARRACDAPPSPPPSPPPERDVGLEHFDPARPSLTPNSPTAVILPFDELLAYLDRALKALSLHTSARNDFITYWLPALSKKPYVALRFLPQPAYERAAELEVTPTPDVMTRVFMLFRGVAAEEADLWRAASERVKMVDWVEVVGVKPEAWDESVFRVLEWGAMEVL